MPEPFASVSDYANTFGTSTNRTDLDLLAASNTIRKYCRWVIWPVQTAEVFVLDGPGTPLLLLPTLALTAVTALSETKRGIGQVATVIPVTDLEWSRKGLIWHGTRRCWTDRAQGVSVTVTHGLVDPPDEIVQLTLNLARREAGNPSRLKRSQVGQRSEEYSVPMLADERAVLAPYRRLV